MKNKFLLLLLLVAGSHFSFGQTSYHVYDSIYQSDYDYATTSWKISKRAYAYIANGCLHEDSFHTEEYDYLSSTWGPFSKDLYQYNGNNKITYAETMKYISGIYRGSSKLQYFYNGTNLTEYITQQWKTHLSAYRNTARNVYNYNNINKTDTFFAQTWDTVSNIWRPSTFTKYFYNADSTYSNSTTYKYFTHLSGYRIYSKSDYTYGGGLLNLTMNYNWDTLTTTWIKTSRKTYT